MKQQFTVIQDTREKEPWSFSNSSFVTNTLIQTLKTGDYTIQGYEDKLCIERKKDIKEFALNVSQARWTNELERMRLFKYRYIIMEFNLQQVMEYPKGLPTGVIQNTRITPQYLMLWVSDIQVKFNVPIIFAGNTGNARYMALNIMRKVDEQENTVSS